MEHAREKVKQIPDDDVKANDSVKMVERLGTWHGIQCLGKEAAEHRSQYFCLRLKFHVLASDLMIFDSF